ncbi:MFS superfamily sulfate permease-like transporter [Paraburkholderia sp. CI2]|uniref:SulP family inorganic anion transporter n=1 Tax=Paraburkholderia sp. CI2 TaxID=2723093 RepID=UPI001610F2DA|nr:SulP family inorganic anion transporter [Paraburkholderia sp. CI2]MBB5464550.1 MFS superfamily sulfate permease-like transporter [Paraburkholderia sp. CI2]
MNTASHASGRPARLSGIRSNVLAGLTSSFALVPECIAFALVAHLNPLMGLYGAFFICTVTALFGGRPGMISGAAGSMALVIVAVTIITVFADLAIAVMCGIVIAALNFAWQHAREIHTHAEDRAGHKTYVPRGTLFFASTTRFHELFDPARDPASVTVDCSHLLLADHSALAALQGLAERYRKAGKQLRMKNLSERNRQLLSGAGIGLA